MSIFEEAGRRGGSKTAAESPKKEFALRRLHTKRRGRRVNSPGVSAPELRKMMRRLRSILKNTQPLWISYPVVARHVGVSERTVRRWIVGEDWPSSESVEKLRQWMKQHEQ